LLGVEVTLELLSLVLVAGTTLLGLVAAAGPNSFHQDLIALSLAGPFELGPARNSTNQAAMNVRWKKSKRRSCSTGDY